MLCCVETYTLKLCLGTGLIASFEVMSHSVARLPFIHHFHPRFSLGRVAGQQH